MAWKVDAKRPVPKGPRRTRRAWNGHPGSRQSRECPKNSRSQSSLRIHTIPSRACNPFEAIGHSLSRPTRLIKFITFITACTSSHPCPKDNHAAILGSSPCLKINRYAMRAINQKVMAIRKSGLKRDQSSPASIMRMSVEMSAP